MRKGIWLALLLLCGLIIALLKPGVQTDILALFSDPRLELLQAASEAGGPRMVFVGEKAADAAKVFVSRSGLPIKVLPRPEDFLDSSSPAYLLSKDQQSLLRSGDAVTKLLSDISRKLASPLSSFYSQFLRKDPLLLLPERILQAGKSIDYSVEDGFLSKPATAIAFLEASKGLSREAQRRYIVRVDNEITRVSGLFPDVEIRWSGLIRFADSSATRMERDLQWISIINLAFITAITVSCFRSVMPFLLCAACVLTGVLGGVTSLALWKGSIHILTLGFGCSLLGACVDYPIHYLFSTAGRSSGGKRGDGGTYPGHVRRSILFRRANYSFGICHDAVFRV